jgi:hypothetical protein
MNRILIAMCITAALAGCKEPKSIFEGPGGGAPVKRPIPNVVEPASPSIAADTPTSSGLPDIVESEPPPPRKSLPVRPPSHPIKTPIAAPKPAEITPGTAEEFAHLVARFPDRSYSSDSEYAKHLDTGLKIAYLRGMAENLNRRLLALEGKRRKK